MLLQTPDKKLQQQRMGKEQHEGLPRSHMWEPQPWLMTSELAQQPHASWVLRDLLKLLSQCEEQLLRAGKNLDYRVKEKVIPSINKHLLMYTNIFYPTKGKIREGEVWHKMHKRETDIQRDNWLQEYIKMPRRGCVRNSAGNRVSGHCWEESGRASERANSYTRSWRRRMKQNCEHSGKRLASVWGKSVRVQEQGFG